VIADACPDGHNDRQFGVVDRYGIAAIPAANQPLRSPASPSIHMLRVPAGFDGADHAIVQRVQAGDLVVTADLPLATQVVARGAQALTPRGQLYTHANIHEHLTLRHVLDELRQRGVDTGGPAPFGPRDRQAFADQLDRWLRRAGSAGREATG